MRNNLPLLSRPLTLSRTSSPLPSISTSTPPPPIPTIRLTKPTPGTTPDTTANTTWTSTTSPLGPQADTEKAPSRKRLVPKKSKLSLLGVGRDKGGDKDKAMDKSNDLSDVLRRVGAASAGRGSFEIYVDPTDDPDIGEIVMVRKNKSRGALDGLQWDALGEMTNVPPANREGGKQGVLKPKGEDKDKWWSIGRGRKDSKEKEREKEKEKEKDKAKKEQREKSKTHAKFPEPSNLPQDTRARFNSFDSGLLLNVPPISTTETVRLAGAQRRHASDEVAPSAERSGTPGLLAPPGVGPNGDSIAIRAMRSVRSLARIGSWAQLRSGTMEGSGLVGKKDIGKEGSGEGVEVKSKEQEKDKKKKKEKKAKKKEKEKKEKAQTIRASSSSFEIGALSTSPAKTLGKKKQSILGIGLPSTMRLPTVRHGSTASSAAPPMMHRLSVDSAANAGRTRAGSVMSSASSLRPVSTSSGASRLSSTASVRWDEEGLEMVKEMRMLERESRMDGDSERAKMKIENKDGMVKKSMMKVKGKDKGEKESRRNSDGRKRTPLSMVFPEVQGSQQVHTAVHEPIVIVEAATEDGHGAPNDDGENGRLVGMVTPVKRARTRPVSEQLLGRSRPKAMHEDEEGVMSILDAATNDLALLINRLDLEATPGTPDMTPLRQSADRGLRPDDNSPTKRLAYTESPLKKGLRGSMASISSLRPYAARSKVESAPQHYKLSHVPSAANLIGQQIAPWSILNDGISPTKVLAKPVGEPASTVTPVPAFRLTHKRTMTPAPAADASPVFKPLHPPKAKQQPSIKTSASPIALPNWHGAPTDRAPSSLTFGSRSSSRSGSRGSFDDANGSPTPNPVFRRAGHVRKPSSLASSKRSHGSLIDASLPLPPDAKRGLGLGGTMGDTAPEVDIEDPDSDIPDELQVILSGQSDEETTIPYTDDTLSMKCPSVGPPAPGRPPEVPLPNPAHASSLDTTPTLEVPVFRARVIDEQDNHADVDEGGNSSSEDDTKKSFDFTGELKKLNESGGSDRRSFVEQLENAFRTPAKIDLRYGFGGADGLLHVELPSVPEMPSRLNEAVKRENSENSSGFDSYSVSRIVDTKEPTLLQGSDSLRSVEGSQDEDDVMNSPRALRSTSSMGSRPSDGQLNTEFKFGGRSQATQDVNKVGKSLTLSDIIPPPSHVRSLSASSTMNDDSVLNSIYAKAVDIPPAAPRMRLDSDSSSKRRLRDASKVSVPSGHSRHSSGISFAGFESFDEVRRGFEFPNDRPAFYPPAGALASRAAHRRHESVFSIASVSSYGIVINNGSTDPFDYGLPGVRERPSSDDISLALSMNVDDTFSFIRRQSRRRRVDSDSSSFYFRAPVPTQMQPYARGHRRHESNMSVSSQAPPISLYNRSFGVHRRNDSNTSTSSVAHSYAMFGANGGRAAWARHRRDGSLDSAMSDFSGTHLGRPGLGDKMFETAADQGMPLTSILASPTESVAPEHLGNRSSFDSILDDRRSSMNDSLFDKTGNRSSMSSDSVFGYDDHHQPQGHMLPPMHLRPLPVFSVNSDHSPIKEDDTMISMLGGGHVRRRSVGSIIEASPCVRVEKRKHSMFQGVPPLKGCNDMFHESPNKARIIEKPSIASTSSYTFGGERMIKAQRGLLERQSLEDSCLIADGEDLTTSIPVPVFSRPGPASRSRSSTCTSLSSGAETPPLSSSDGTMSESSQSSIDLSHLNVALYNTTYPIANAARSRTRARARGHGHRRRISVARASRSSVYETIEEELSNLSNPPTPARPADDKNSRAPVSTGEIFIVDPDSTIGNSTWDDERGIVALRKYYALRDEAENTVTDSKRTWLDTPFSVFALQSFYPPRHPEGMQALLQHSVQNYGPLPSELRPRRVRSRTQSRVSPYPQARSAKASLSPEHTRSSIVDINRSLTKSHPPALQPIPINPNVLSPPRPVENVKASPVISKVEPKRENAFGLAFGARPRVPSNARRTALGWSKRSTGKSSTENKENIGQGMLTTPGESLRINRPRPRGRPTPASQRPIRI